MAKKAIGIYFSTDVITLLEMEHTSGNPKIFNFRQFDFSESDTEKAVNEVKTYLKENKIKAGKVHVAFSGFQVTHKRFLIPAMKTSELSAFVFREMRKTLSMPPKDITFDYYIAGRIKEGGSKKLDVIGVITTKKEVQRYTSFLVKCGILPTVMTTAPLALWSAYSLANQTEPNATVALIFIDKRLVTIGIFNNSLISFSREFRLPQKRSSSENDRHRIEDGSQEDTSAYRKILTEVHRTILNYKHQFRESKVDKIVLATVEENFERLSAKFKTDFNLEVDGFNLSEKISPSIDIETDEELDDRLVVPAGLAWRAIRDIKINLLPLYIKERQKNIYKRILTTIVIISLSILLVAGYFILNNVIDSYSTVFKSKQVILNPVKDDLKDIKMMMEKRALFERKKSLVKMKDKPAVISDAFLRDLALIQPDGMVYKSINIFANTRGDWLFSMNGALTAVEKPGRATANITNLFNTFLDNIKSSPFILKINKSPKVKTNRRMVENKIISSLTFTITGSLYKSEQL